MYISKNLTVIIGIAILTLMGISVLFAVSDLPPPATRSGLYVKEYDLAGFSGTKDLGSWMMCSVSGLMTKWSEKKNQKDAHYDRGLYFRLLRNCGANPESDNNCRWTITMFNYSQKGTPEFPLYVMCWNTTYVDRK